MGHFSRTQQTEFVATNYLRLGHTWMRVAGKDVLVKVRMDRNLANRLERLARRRHATRSEIVREAIELAEREGRRRSALGTLLAQAEQDRRRLGRRRHSVARFALG